MTLNRIQRTVCLKESPLKTWNMQFSLISNHSFTIYLSYYFRCSNLVDGDHCDISWGEYLCQCEITTHRDLPSCSVGYQSRTVLPHAMIINSASSSSKTSIHFKARNHLRSHKSYLLHYVPNQL